MGCAGTRASTPNYKAPQAPLCRRTVRSPGSDVPPRSRRATSAMAILPASKRPDPARRDTARPELARRDQLKVLRARASVIAAHLRDDVVHRDRADDEYENGTVRVQLHPLSGQREGGAPAPLSDAPRPQTASIGTGHESLQHPIPVICGR